MKKKSPFFQPGQRPELEPPSSDSWLGTPIWVKGQVRVSLTHALRLRGQQRRRWLVKGDHLSHPAPFLLPVLRKA